MSQESGPIRVAISGGGLAGASLLHALLKQPNLDVHIFESAPVFREAGAAIGLNKVAQSALKLIGHSAIQAFERAGAVPHSGMQVVLAQGPDNGKTVKSFREEHNLVAIVHRAEFLRELLADAPSERLHASKKLVKVDEANGDKGPIVLHFADGTLHECDILIGADGIHSSVRKFIVGESDPAASAVPTGWWLVQVLKPYDELAALISKRYCDIENPGEMMWIGDGAVVFHNILSEGQLAQFVIVVSYNESTDKDWTKTVTSEEIRRIYADWPTELGTAVEKLVCNEPSHPALCFWEHLPAHTYARGPLAVMGDAAHATTPWQGNATRGVYFGIEAPKIDIF